MQVINLLAVETSAGQTSAAFWDGASIHSRTETEPNKQAERLLPMIGELLHSLGKTPSDVAAYAATLGPGSFTGIRIGLAGLVGLHAVTGGALYGATTLDLASFSGKIDAAHTVILNAMRGQAYVQHFSAIDTPSSTISLENLEGLELSGPVITNCRELLPDGLELVDTPPSHAEKLLQLLLDRAKRGTLTASALAPVYVRPPDAKLPTKKPL